MTSNDDQSLLDFLTWNSCVSHERQLFYVATPKVACTSLKWWFAELEGVAEAVRNLKTSSETDPELVIHDSLRVAAPHLCVHSPEQLEEIKKGGFLIFALVRNPYKRLFSAWQSKILLREPYQIEPYLGQAFVEYPIETKSDVAGAFECFLEYLNTNEKDDFKDWHWAPQYDLLKPQLFPYTFVSKIEDTTELNEALRTHLGDAYVNPFTTSKANESLIPYLPEFISPRSRELIELLYAKDFEAYGYSLELPPAKVNFSDEHLDLALKGIQLLRGRHLRITEIRQHCNAEFSALLVDKNWLAEQREVWMALCKEKEAELVDLQGYCATEAQAFEATRAELERLKVELAQSNAALAHSNSELQRSNAELATCSEDGVQLEARLANSVLEAEGLRSELVQASSELVQLKSSLAQTNSVMAQANSELAQLKAELARSATELAQSGSELVRSNTELAKSNSELSRSNNDLAQTNQQLEWSRAELEKLKVNVASLISEREAFALKHKRYLSVHHFVETGLVSRLRKAGQLVKGRKGE
ncbi:sulfotransferase family protein [Pseudomonas hamedanensis]|uniref:Sulfotransferase family 2 domain-containing protein n=1 Tax=Pseudomonas hamedanensis TaxID=2745504 RepID=A0A9E6TG56_9PSED|nr:sulfotransferase family protein [Pseudomonas hamedanensis]QXI16354.1 sulfotransferase family 2 domain-containing protein [Pseudomonas hamedanensis]